MLDEHDCAEQVEVIAMLTPVPGRPGWWSDGLSGREYLPENPQAHAWFDRKYKGYVFLLRGGRKWLAQIPPPDYRGDHEILGRFDSMEAAMHAIEERVLSKMGDAQLELFR